jgi:hypothetical protein
MHILNFFQFGGGGGGGGGKTKTRAQCGFPRVRFWSLRVRLLYMAQYEPLTSGPNGPAVYVKPSSGDLKRVGEG